MQDFLLEEEDVQRVHVYVGAPTGIFNEILLWTIKKCQICPFSFKAIMTFNLIPMHPQHESLGMRPFGAGNFGAGQRAN